MSSVGRAIPEPHGLWGRAFRPFFLAGALHTAIVLPWWALAWLGALDPPAWLTPTAWHGHEMLFGLVAAAIAGFLLTASPVWSGGPALTGAPLAGLAGLWLAGRLALALPQPLPAWGIALVDVAFLPAVGLAVARTLWGSGQLRNYALVVVVAALSLANVAIHGEALGWGAGGAARALRFAVECVVVLILVIGGRITPAFTANALRRRGDEAAVRNQPWLDALAIGAAAALALAGLVAGRGVWTGALAVLAGLAAAARMAGWQSGRTRSDPLLWSLHAGSAWLAAGLLLVGASDLGAPVPTAAGLHALTAGAMGGTILAVMTRVGLGHTGRPLVLPSGVVVCYALVHAAAVARVAAPLAGAELQRALLLASAAAWSGAFGLFGLFYAPILVRPRADGAPG